MSVGPAGASAATTLPTKAQQIAVLKAAEKKIAAAITSQGVTKAYFDDVDLGDLRSFGIEPLWNRGIDGAGTTVAVIEGWRAYPSVLTNVNNWSKQYGLPKLNIKTVYPAGALPKKCPARMVALGDYGSCAAWQGELELDVDAVHLFAPYARIVISATPADSQPGEDQADQVAPPEMMKALEYLSTKHIANAISISDGTGESTYQYGRPEILAQNPGLLTAAAHGVPVAVATGDCGAAQELATGGNFCAHVTPFRSTSTWDDSPYALALGGVTPGYTYTGPGGLDQFTVWNQDGGAENAGLSKIYRMPSYQSGVASITGGKMRAVPDITMDAQDGTSEAAPEFGGVLALATQLNKADLGPINKVLYENLGPAGSADGITDVTKGNDTLGKVKGYTAGPGYDIATGWGTIDAAKFVPALVKATDSQNPSSTMQKQAAAQLAQLQDAGSVAPDTGTAATRREVKGSGYVPAMPVSILVDGHQFKTVRANSHGDVALDLKLSSLKLGQGKHTLTLKGMLLTQNITFQVTG